jgi:hypothetical protein
LRGARRDDGRHIHLLSALDTSTGIVQAQVTVDAKSNEIPAFTPLLDAVEAVLGSIEAVLFMADALHTQTGHAHEIAARGAHLMTPVKGNQPTLLAQLKTLPWPKIPVGDRTRDRGHGRRETRTVKAVTLHTPGGIAFPHAQQGARITRTRTNLRTRQDQPRNGLPDRVPARRPGPARRPCRTASGANGSSKTRSTTCGT